MREGWLRALVGALLSLGLVARALPLFDLGGRLLRQFPTEDGYLTLQIARNMALGHGMSVSAGTIPTNGTQPFWTYVCSIAYRIVDADKTDGVLLVLLLSLAVAIASAWLMVRVGDRWLADVPNRRAIVRLATGLWFASPLVVLHSMNCLETGLYGLAVLVSIEVLGQRGEPGRRDVTGVLTIGVALGWTFWVRNDAVFLILGVCVGNWLVGVRKRGLPWLGRSLHESLGIGVVTIAIASPWLYSNYANFGYLMPISGVSESMGAAFAHNLYLVPGKLVEYFGVVVPIPLAVEVHPAGYALLTLVLGVILWRTWIALQQVELLHKTQTWVVVIFIGSLTAFYGLYFGAPFFVSRYFFPFSPFLAFAGAAALLWLMNRSRAMKIAGALAAVAIPTAGNALIYRHGTSHMHLQVVSWVNENVEEEVWVGAIQTGTLGYFHDRTINLDGKVNPEALRARQEDTVGAYVVGKPLGYLVDWTILRRLHRHPEILEHFEVVLEDENRNLAVMKRR